MGKDKEKSEAKGETPPKPTKSRDNSASRKKENDKSSTAKSKVPKKRTGLFSKFRKSTTDLSEWSKTDEKLQTAVDNDDVGKVQNFLAKKGVDPTKVDPKGQTAFHRAAEQGKIEIVETMIAYKANLDAQDVQGRTPLSCAVKYGRTEVADRLLQEKNNTGLGDLKKQTPLHHATIGGSAECVRLLIRYHAPVDQPDKDGRTALHYSSLMGYLNICRELTDARSNVNAKDGDNRTPLMCAAEYGQVQVCELLVKKGASTLFTDVNGNNAAQWAAKSGFTEIKSILEKAPTQANWSIGPGPEEEDTEDVENQVEVLQHTGRDSPDIAPYEGDYTQQDQVEHGVVPLEHVKNISDFILPSSKESLHSSVKVNYSDDDDICDLVPMEEMRQIDQEQMDEMPVDIPEHYQQQQHHTMVTSVSETVYTNHQPNHVEKLDSDSVHSTEHGEEEIHAIIQNVEVSAGRSRPNQDDSVSQNTIDKDKYDELEEEHDHLSSELQQVMLENRRLQQHVTQLEGQLKEVDKQPQVKEETTNVLVMEDNPLINTLEAEISELREEVDVEKDKNVTLMNEIGELRKLTHSSKVVESDQSGDDSWNDSAEDEMFTKKGKSTSSQAMQLAVLKSQVLELTQENTKLKEQIQSDSARLHTSYQEHDTSHSLTDLRELSQFEGIQLAHEQEVRAFRERIGKLEHQLQNFSDRLNEVEDEKFVISEEKDMIQGQYNDLLSANVKMQQEVDDVKHEMRHLSSQSTDDSVKDLYREVEKLRGDNRKLVEDLEGLVEVNEQLQEDKKDLLDQMDSIDDLVQFRQQVHEEAEHLESEKQQLTQLMEDIRGMAEKDRQQQTKDKDKASPSEVVIEVQSQTMDHSSPLASLTLEQINLEDLQATPEKPSDKDQVGAVEADIKKKKSDLLSLEKQTGTAVTDLSQIKADIARERKDLTALQNEVSSAKDELSFVEKALGVQKDELKKTEHALKSKKQKEQPKSDEKGEKDNSQTESSSILDQLESLNQELAVKRTQFSDLQMQRENLLSENQQALDHQEAAEAEIRRLKDDKQFLLSEHQSLERILGSEKAAVHILEQDILKMRQQKQDVEKLHVEKKDTESKITEVEVIQVQQVQSLAAAKPRLPPVDTDAHDALIEDNKDLKVANTNLKVQIRQLMESNDGLSKKNAVLGKEVKHALHEKEELATKVTAISNQLQELTNVNLELTHERSEIAERLKKAVQSNESLETMTSQQQSEIKQVLQDHKKLAQEKQKVNQHLRDVQDEYKELLEEKEQLEKTVSEVKGNLKKADLESNRLGTELKRLQDNKKDLTSQSAALQDNLERVKQSKTDFQRQITATELKCHGLLKENENLSTHNKTLTKEVQELSDDNNNLKHHTKELSGKVQELQDQVKEVGAQDYRGEIEQLKKRLKELKDDNDKLKKYVEELEDQSGVSAGVNYRSEYELVLSNNEHLLAEINAIREENNPVEVKVLRNQNEELQSERKQLESNNSSLQNLIESLNNSVGKDRKLESKSDRSSQDQIEALEEEIQKLMITRDTLRQQNEQLMKEANVANSNMATLQKASEEIIRDQQQEKSMHEDKIAKLLNSNEKLLNNLEEMHRERNDLQDARAALQKTLDNVISERKRESEKEVNKELTNTKDKLMLVQNEKLSLLNDLQSLQREIDAGKLKEQMRLSVTKDTPDRLALLQAELQNERKHKEEVKKQNEQLLKEKEKWKARPVTEVVEVKSQPLLQSSREKTDQVKQLQQKNDKLSAAIDNLKATNGKLASELDKITKELQAVKKQAKKSVSEQERQGEMDKLTEDNKGLQVQVSKLHVQVEDLKEENEAKLQDLMEEQDMLLEKIKELESNAAQTKNRGEVLNARDVSEKDEIIQELEGQCDQLQVQLKNKDKQVQELQDSKAKLEKAPKNRGSEVVSSPTDAYMASLREENANLREKLTEAEDSKSRKSERSTPEQSKDPDIHGEDKQLKELQDQLDNLKAKLAEAEQHHNEVVNTYRSHLLAAVQGCMDPDVKKSLTHIVSLRNNNTE